MAASLVEVYTADAVVTGYRADATELRDVLEAGERLRLQQPRWAPLRPTQVADPALDSLAVDDIIAVVAPIDPRRVVHASWHDVVLEGGPYRIAALLPVLPGFDPGRALTRPGGTFIHVREAKLSLIDQPDAGELERDYVLVNRYAIDRVASDLILAFFFPAARLETLEGVPAG